MQHLKELGSFLPGSRIGIMLVHGLAGTPTEMKFVAKRLNKYGFSVLCPLLAGHCSSEADLVATNWKDWTTSVENAYERMAEHMDVVFVGGLSAGAVLSLYLAQCKPKGVRGLCLYSTTLCWDGWSIPKLSFLLPLVLRLPYIGKRYRFEEVYPYGIMNEKLRSRIYSQMQSGDSSTAGHAATPGTSLRELWRLVDIVKKGLPKVFTPTFIVHARNDDIASLRNNAAYVKQHIGGPAELLLLENSYHMITVDQERNTVCDATAVYFHNLLSEAEKTELARHAQAAIFETMSEPAAENDESYPGRSESIVCQATSA